MRLLILLLFMATPIFAQEFTQKLYQTHDAFKEPTLTKRRFRHADMVPLIENLKNRSDLFEVSVASKSSQGRELHLIKMGKGTKKILLWSQMHGDESTATMAIFDIFRWFQADDEFNDLRKKLLNNCTFYFVPMLNPDGAEVFQRRTSLNIDMNRDALNLQNPESQLLKSLQQTLKPDFGFNLHDQNRLYSAGKTKNLATISFLATAYDQERNINDVRKRSMQLILSMNRVLQQFIPNQVGRYSDEHEPRAFGDNIQKWGTTLILIESGGYANDPEKQYIRKLNYVALLSALEAIATGSYKKENIKDYPLIPENEKSIFDLIIRRAKVKFGDRYFVMDIGINRAESPVANKDYFTTKSTIEELGDMSVFYGLEEINAEDMEVIAEKELFLGMKADLQLMKDGQVVYTIKNGKL